MRRSSVIRSQGPSISLRSTRLATPLAIVLVLALVLAPAPGAGAAGSAPVEGHWQGKTAQGLPIFFGVREGTMVNVRWTANWGLCAKQEVTYRQARIPIEEGGGFHETFAGLPIAIEGSFSSPSRAVGRVVFPKTTGLPGCPHKVIAFHAAPIRALQR